MKNLFLWHSQSWIRKGIEALLTLLVENIWTKYRVLEVYLNIAKFSGGIFGVEAQPNIFSRNQLSTWIYKNQDYSRPLYLTEEEKILAIKATQVIGLEVAGVDFFRAANRVVFLELNPSSGFESIEQINRIDITLEIVDYFIRKISQLP